LEAEVKAFIGTYPLIANWREWRYDLEKWLPAIQQYVSLVDADIKKNNNAEPEYSI
jgi:hypothetical protein